MLGVNATGWACTLCNKQVMDDIYESQFYPNLFTMLSAFIVLGLIVAGLSVWFSKSHKTRLTNLNVQIPSPVPLTIASMVLGIGLGGFIDGIMFHQIFQTHSMLSNKISTTDYVGKSVNMFWDGIFHFFCLLVVLLGIVLLWELLFKAHVDRSGKLLSGGLLLGWGLFNIVEGIINHHLLALHNVIELSPNQDFGNFTFLGGSVIVVVVGYMLVKNHTKPLVSNLVL